MNNFDKIKSNIHSIIPLTADEWDLVENKIEISTIKKNDYFLRENSVCNSVAFVDIGSFVYCKMLDNGDEITVDFAFNGEWITDNHSRLTNIPSNFSIKAIESSELQAINKENITVLYKEIPKFERFSRLLMEQAYVKLAQHTIDLQTLSATDRYLKLLHQYPNLFQLVPLYHIANYLGIAPKSLSRIRKSFSLPK